MRSVPDDDDDRKDMDRLKPEPWMLEALGLNPAYCSWGPHEDYMITREGDDGWNASKVFPSWAAFGPWDLNDLNECVNFYFHIERDSKDCEACGHTGYNPATREIADTFYDHGDYSIDFVNMRVRGDAAAARRPDGATGRRWSDKITDDEFAALKAAGRCREYSSAQEANEAERGDRRGFGHDAINRCILVQTRAERLGVYGLCEACAGEGYAYTAPAGRLALTVWWLHPRKGCSRGIEVSSLTRDDFRAAIAWLAEAARRNAERFAAVSRLAEVAGG
jgi:hypothetical protein